MKRLLFSRSHGVADIVGTTGFDNSIRTQTNRPLRVAMEQINRLMKSGTGQHYSVLYPLSSQRHRIVFAPGLFDLFGAQHGQRAGDTIARGVRPDDVVDITALGRNER